MTTLQNISSVQNHGHRGARGRRPENTLAAVDYAIRSGADGVEVDLRLCADGSVVVFHDAAVSPTLAMLPGAGRDFSPLALADATVEELRAFDIGTALTGSDYAEQFPDQVPVPGERIPTLTEFLDHALRHGPDSLVLNLELKSDGEPAGDWIDGYVDQVLRAVELREIVSRIYLQSFDWRLAKAALARCPDLLVGLLTDQQPDAEPCIPEAGNPSAWSDGMDLSDFGGSVPCMVSATGARVWSAHYRDLYPEKIIEAHGLGLAVYTWTVNDDADMKRLIDWGVDTITTDYPDRLSGLLREMAAHK